MVSVSDLSLSATPRMSHVRWVILAIILLADIVDLLDASIANIAAPTIAASLGGGPALVQWLGASYALSMGALLVLGGRLGDKYGRRRLFLIGLCGFTLASLACGLALTPLQIVAARLVQGAFGALLIPQGFGIIGDVFPQEELGKAFSAFGPAMGLSAVGGPILAGALMQADIANTGWRAAFLINLVLGGAGLLAAWLVLPRDRGDCSVQIDLPGAALLSAAALATLFSLIEGAASGWTTPTLACGVAGLLLFTIFCRQQRRSPEPLLQPSLFRNRGFTSGLAVGIAFFAALAGLLLVVGIYVQYGLAFTPFAASLTMAPVALGITISAVIAARFIAERGRAVVYAGMVLTLAGIAGLIARFAIPALASVGWSLAPPLFVVGLGAGAAFGAVFSVALGDIDPSEAGSASGSLSAVQQLASAAGIAAVTTLYFQRVQEGGQTAAALATLAAIAVLLLVAIGLVRRMPMNARSGGD